MIKCRKGGIMKVSESGLEKEVFSSRKRRIRQAAGAGCIGGAWLPFTVLKQIAGDAADALE